MRSVKRWGRRAGNRWLLGAVFAITLVETLRLVPEMVPLGHVVGNIALTFAYAYAGAWVFHEVALEIPRRRQRDAAYDGCWLELSWLANDGVALLDHLEPYAYGWKGDRPSTPEELSRFLRLIWTGEQRSRWGTGVGNPAEIVREHATMHQDHLARLSPFVHLLDEEVAAVLLRFSVTGLLRTLQRIPTEAETQDVWVPTENREWRTVQSRSTLADRGVIGLVDLTTQLRERLADAQPARASLLGTARLGSLADFNEPEPWSPQHELRPASERLLTTATST